MTVDESVTAFGLITGPVRDNPFSPDAGYLSSQPLKQQALPFTHASPESPALPVPSTGNGPSSASPQPSRSWEFAVDVARLDWHERQVPRRFAEKFTETDGCWEWTASARGNGYGQYRQTYAHRASHELLVGRIPDGLHIDHLCRNKRCVNPDHLDPVTPGENVRRGLAGAHHAAKTHCPSGHPYAGANLYVTSQGFRMCKTCAREHAKASRARRKALVEGVLF